MRRVLQAKFALGLFEHPFVDEVKADLAFDTSGHRELARRAAERSIVLLCNEGVLPFTEGIKRIAVLGPGADDRRLLQGDYHYPAHQEISYYDGTEESVGWPAASTRSDNWRPGRYYTEHITPLAGIRALAGADREVLYLPGCAVTGSDSGGISNAAQLAQNCDVAVVVVAGRSGLSRVCTVGEARDATSLQLTGVQRELVQAVAGTGVATVVVVISGRVHTLADIAPLSQALLYAGPLGEEGGQALAEVLFGTVNPSGRLPVTLPRSVGQVPLHLGHRAGGSTSMIYDEYTDLPVSPLFPFGHGLSYTQFSYGDLSVEASSTSQPLFVSVDVTNVGERPGEEVVQLYASDVVASVARPERQLVGFARVPLDPGERRRVVFELHPSRLAFYNEDMHRVVEPGEFRLYAGTSSTDVRAAATACLGGGVAAYPIASIVPTTARTY